MLVDSKEITREDDKKNDALGGENSLHSIIHDKNDIEQNTKNEEPSPTLLLFKCFYCDECFEGNDGNECNIKRVNHTDIEHHGKAHYPTPDDFENRMEK
jgi:hypothetical protein